MSKRSFWKGIYSRKFSLSNQIIKTLSKNCIISPKYLNVQFEVYNGKSFTKIQVTKNMIGYKLGQFVKTRKEFSFKKKKGGSKN
jgi:ribosomal protein S19